MPVEGREPHTQAGIASAESGLVLLDGPNGVAIAMTPDAALATADSLNRAAAEARMQPRLSSQPPTA